MKRLITGVKPTGNGMHVGNFLGAIKPFLENAGKYESYLFIADYHSLSSVHDAQTLKNNKFNIMLEYFSLVPDDLNVTIFDQSSVQHINDITWILSSVTPYSLMLKAHSFKDAQAKNHEINMATFNYPILMAADILSYDVDVVPVGKDQIQHIEFARDIAGNFNKTYGQEFFKLPTYIVDEELATIPGIDGRKMSKSYNNFIPIFDSEKNIKKAIMSIVTDDTPLEAPKNPDTCNVFALMKFFASPTELETIRAKYLAGNYGYGHAKLELLEMFLAYFKNARERFFDYKENPDKLYAKLAQGNQKANALVSQKYQELIKIIWLQ